MIHERLVSFLNLARDYPNLLIDLCAEPDLLSRAQVLAILERYGVKPDEKDHLIERFRKTDILVDESNGAFSINPVVAKLVNYYERRGALVSATFLRDQMMAIVELSRRLRRELAEVDIDRVALSDAIDNLSRLVHDVLTIGKDHHLACMRLLGDIKRAGSDLSLAERIDRLATAQRRHIEPLRALTDPNDEYQPRFAEVESLINALKQRRDVLSQSQETEYMARRLRANLRKLDHELLRRFVEVADAARALLESLLAEQSLKDALAFCLARLDQVWPLLAAQTILAPGRRVYAAPPAKAIEAFMHDIVQQKLLPRPRPLRVETPQQESIETRVITEQQVWHAIAAARVIASWPAFVQRHFGDYETNQIMVALTLPILRNHPQVRWELGQSVVQLTCHGFMLQLHDFSVSWEEIDEHPAATGKRRHPTPVTEWVPV